MIKKISLSICLFFLCHFQANAQNQTAFETALNQSNKMIAVIVVLAVILIGIAFFLFYLERRIKQLEDKTKS